MLEAKGNFEGLKTKNIIIYGNCFGFPESFYELCLNVEVPHGNLKEITQDSQTSLLKILNVRLHDHMLKFEDIMDKNSFLQLDTPKVFLEFFKPRQSVNIGEKLSNADNYIQRYLKRSKTSPEFISKGGQNQGHLIIPKEKMYYTYEVTIFHCSHRTRAVKNTKSADKQP